MDSSSIILSVESVLDQLLDQKWIHPSASRTDKLLALNGCIKQLTALLQDLSYESKYQLLNGNTPKSSPLYQILFKLKNDPQTFLHDIYWSIMDVLIQNGSDISIPLSIGNINHNENIHFGIYYHIQITMKHLNKTDSEIIDKILYLTNLWYECKLSLYEFNLSSYPSVVTFTNHTNMVYLYGVSSSMPSNDIIYKLFCNGFQVFNVPQNNNNLTNKKKWSDLGLVFMVYLNYKENMSKSLRFYFQETMNIMPFADICDIIDNYQFGSTSMIYSQIVSDNEWIIYALKYIYSHSVKWKRFLMDNILLNENILKPKQFKIVQQSIAKWDVHTFFWSKWLKQELDEEMLCFYMKFYNGKWEKWHIISLINKYLNNLKMMKLILSNCRYIYDKVWFEKPLLLLPKTKKLNINKKINAKSTLLFDLLTTRDLTNNDKIFVYIIDYLIDLKNGKIEHVRYENMYMIHKMFIDLYSMFCKQFRSNDIDENHVIWGNMKYLLIALKHSKCNINIEWNKKFDIDYGLYEAYLSRNIMVGKFLINSDIIDIERCLKMGYLSKMFKLILKNYDDDGMRVQLLPLIIDSLLKCNNTDKLQSYLMDWLQESRNSRNMHCINILSSAVSAMCTV